MIEWIFFLKYVSIFDEHGNAHGGDSDENARCNVAQIVVRLACLRFLCRNLIGLLAHAADHLLIQFLLFLILGLVFGLSLGQFVFNLLFYLIFQQL